MKQRGNAAVLIVLIVAIAVGFFIATNYSNNRTKPTLYVQTTQTPAPTSKPESTSSAVTNDGKMYTDAKFSISPPSDWKEIPLTDQSSARAAYFSKDYEREKSGNLNLIKGYSVTLYIGKVPWDYPGLPGDQSVSPIFTKEVSWIGEKAWFRHYDYEGTYTTLTAIHKNIPYQMVMESVTTEERQKNEALFLEVANTLKVE